MTLMRTILISRIHADPISALSCFFPKLDLKIFRFKPLKITVLTFGCALISLSAQDAPSEQKTVSDQDIVSQWLHTERLIASEATQWQEENTHLSQLLSLYQKELSLLQEELSKAGKNASLIDTEAEELKSKITASEEARRALISYLNQLRPRVTSLISRFPEPLQDQLLDQSAILAKKVTNTNADSAFRSIVRVLQDAESFNRGFVIEQQEITLGDTNYHANVMYFGLSRAYFLAGEKAGIALPGQNGWTFTERNELADELEKAFAIQAKETPSAYFSVPLQNVSK